MEKSNEELILGIDASTKTLGIALFGLESKKLLLLTHVSPKVKIDDDMSSTEVLIKKAQIFENEFIKKYVDRGIVKVIIEEPLISSNNSKTCSVLLKFSGMIAKSVYDLLGVAPEYISSYNSRAWAFPNLLQIRKTDKDGNLLSEKELRNKKPVLFGGHPKNADKKLVIWSEIADMYPEVIWEYDKHQKLSTTNFDLSDAACAVIGYCNHNNIW